MGKQIEIGLIILLVTVIIVIHSVPIVSNFISEDEDWFKNTINQINIDLEEKPEKEIKEVVIDNRKATNILQESQLEYLLTLIDNENEVCEKLGGLDCGDCIEVCHNKDIEEFLMNVLSLNKYHKIYTCKASKNHQLKTNKFEIMNNFDGELKKATKIWYYFPEEWNIDEWWILKDSENNRFYAPELNSIIEFNASDNYEWLKLNSENTKNFIIIIKFTEN